MSTSQNVTSSQAIASARLQKLSPSDTHTHTHQFHVGPHIGFSICCVISIQLCHFHAVIVLILPTPQSFYFLASLHHLAKLPACSCEFCTRQVLNVFAVASQEFSDKFGSASFYFCKNSVSEERRCSCWIAGILPHSVRSLDVRVVEGLFFSRMWL